MSDAKILRSVARGDYNFDPQYLRRFQYEITKVDDLFTISAKYNAVYRGVLNLIYYHAKGIHDWKNNDRVSFNTEDLDDHHVFPKKYLRSKYSNMEQRQIDCVLNRTLVPKITNIKIGGRKPSEYLQELQDGNGSLPSTLEAHLIPPKLIDGSYDDKYEIFLQDRGSKVIDIINNEILPLRTAIEDKMFGL